MTERAIQNSGFTLIPMTVKEIKSLGLTVLQHILTMYKSRILSKSLISNFMQSFFLFILKKSICIGWVGFFLLFGKVYVLAVNISLALKVTYFTLFLNLFVQKYSYLILLYLLPTVIVAYCHCISPNIFLGVFQIQQERGENVENFSYRPSMKLVACLSELKD